MSHHHLRSFLANNLKKLKKYSSKYVECRQMLYKCVVVWYKIVPFFTPTFSSTSWWEKLSNSKVPHWPLKACFFNEFPPAKNKKKHKVGKKKTLTKLTSFFWFYFIYLLLFFRRARKTILFFFIDSFHSMICHQQIAD